MNEKPFFHKLFGTKPGDDMQPKEAIAYSITGFGQNLICTIIGSYLMMFMTDAIGFDNNMTLGGVVGTMAVAYLMLATRIFDALNDPIMGSIVDRTRTKWGKCRPYLKWMAIPIAIITVLCFLPAFKATSGGFAAISVIYITWSVVYTIADVPYWGLSTAMTNNTRIRGNMLTVARLFCTAGAGIVTIGLPVFTANIPKAKGLMIEEVIDGASKWVPNPAMLTEYMACLRWIYFVAALIIVVVSVPMFYYGFKNTKERYTATEAPPSLKHNLQLLFKNKPLMLIVLSGILGSAKMVYGGAGGLYFAKYALGNEGMYGLITMLVIPGGLVASILVPWFTKKFGKKNTFIYSHLLGAAAMLVMYFVGYQTKTELMLCAAALIIIGIPQGFSNIMTYAMIGDTVEYLEWKTGERAEGICFAMQTFINKIGMAAGAFIGLIAYQMTNIFQGNSATITVEATNKLWNILVLSGVISMFLCVVPMFFYDLTEKRQAQLVGEIEERKAEKAAAESNLASDEAK
ncbi:MAG: glycoside-pentoside-hexuronide (GPH):cation symporter [Clostridia bacterium]